MEIIKKKCKGCGFDFELSSYLRNQKFYCTARCAYDHRKVFTKKIINIIIKKYSIEQLSLNDIALCVGLKYHNIRKVLIDAKIKIRTNAEQQKINFKNNPLRHVGSTQVVYCGQCNEKLIRWTSQVTKSKIGKCFCTKECFDVYQTIRSSIVNYGKGWNNIRRIVRQRDGCCKICNKSKKDNCRELSVHHISPMRWFKEDKITANLESNLICLCDKCHTRVDNRIREYERKMLHSTERCMSNRVGEKSLTEIRYECRKIKKDGIS